VFLSIILTNLLTAEQDLETSWKFLSPKEFTTDLGQSTKSLMVVSTKSLVSSSIFILVLTKVFLVNLIRKLLWWVEKSILVTKQQLLDSQQVITKFMLLAIKVLWDLLPTTAAYKTLRCLWTVTLNQLPTFNFRQISPKSSPLPQEIRSECGVYKTVKNF
jgi:flagellar biosynthesis protein FlhB